jgi:hypothetical protein
MATPRWPARNGSVRSLRQLIRFYQLNKDEVFSRHSRSPSGSSLAMRCPIATGPLRHPPYGKPRFSPLLSPPCAMRSSLAWAQIAHNAQVLALLTDIAHRHAPKPVYRDPTMQRRTHFVGKPSRRRLAGDKAVTTAEQGKAKPPGCARHQAPDGGQVACSSS